MDVHQRAEAARREMPALNEAFADIRKDLLARFEASAPDDHLVRERIYAALCLIKSVKHMLCAYVSAGDLDQYRLEVSRFIEGDDV